MIPPLRMGLKFLGRREAVRGPKKSGLRPMTIGTIEMGIMVTAATSHIISGQPLGTEAANGWKQYGSEREVIGPAGMVYDGRINTKWER